MAFRIFTFEWIHGGIDGAYGVRRRSPSGAEHLAVDWTTATLGL